MITVKQWSNNGWQVVGRRSTRDEGMLLILRLAQYCPAGTTFLLGDHLMAKEGLPTAPINLDKDPQLEPARPDVELQKVEGSAFVVETSTGPQVVVANCERDAATYGEVVAHAPSIEVAQMFTRRRSR